MRKKILALLSVMALTLTCGCGNNSTQKEITDGVYYEAIPQSEITDTRVKTAEEPEHDLDYLYYDGGIYTYNSFVAYADTVDDFKETGYISQKICDLQYNNTAYSSDSDKLGTTIKGDAWLYELEDYDKDFAVGVITKDEDGGVSIRTYFKYNDITLEKGSDLYKDKLHFDELSEAGSNEYGTFENELFMSDESMKILDNFINCLYEGKFTNKTISGKERNLYHFHSASGICTRVGVYEDGYAVINADDYSYIILKMDSDACRKLIEYSERMLEK